MNVLHVLIRDLHNRNIININFILFDQMKKKIQRSFKYIYLYGYGHFSCPLLFSAQYFRLARLRPEQALQGSVLWDYEYAQEWYALPDRR